MKAIRRWIPGALLALGVAVTMTLALGTTAAQEPTSDDVEPTSEGPITIRPLMHGSVLLQFKEKSYYFDPAGTFAWDSLPKADLILITHEHGDHHAPAVITRIRKDGTQIVANEAVAKKIASATAMRNGDRLNLLGVTIDAVPSYNVVRTSYHPRGRDNGYVVTFGDRRVYVAGDTEATPELKALEKIDIAFLPISLPFTMSPDDAVDAARAFKPRILYPYHQNSGDPNVVKTKLADVPEIEVRVRKLP